MLADVDHVAFEHARTRRETKPHGAAHHADVAVDERIDAGRIGCAHRRSRKRERKSQQGEAV